jgi:hypothetical protein
MSKDPALLFYTSDFLTGTMLMSHEQVGIYIRILCLLHQNKGSLDQLSFDSFVGNHDCIKSKFRYSDGKVFHDRLLEEMERRQSFCESRRKSRMTHVQHTSDVRQVHVGRMETETATETKAVNTTKHINTSKPRKAATYVRDNPPSLEDISPYCKEKGIDPQQFHDANTAVGWVDKNKVPYRDWKAVVRKWANYRNATAPVVAAAPGKRPIGIVVVEKIAAGKNDHDILHDLIGTYTEHAINEALGHARGNFK